jgi:hypothetical protein
MPLKFADIMDEFSILRENLVTFLTNYTVASAEVSWLYPNPTEASVHCYYYPKRNTKAIALCSFVLFPKEYALEAWKPSLLFAVYIYEDYSLYFRGDEELLDIIKPFFLQYKETMLSKYDAQYKAQKFMKACKRELMEAAWHPRRIEAWLNAGADLDGI